MEPVATKRKNNLMLFLLIIFLFTAVSFGATNAAFMVTQNIYHGVTVEGIPVGGLTVQEAERRLSTHFGERLKYPLIELLYENNKWEITANQIDFSIDAASLAREAYQIGRRGGILQQLRERYLAIYHSYSVPLAMSYNHEKLQSVVIKIAKEMNRDAQSAYLTQYKGGVFIVPEIIGVKVNVAQTVADIVRKMNTTLPVRAEISVEKVVPPILAQDLASIDGIIAAYTTQFDPRDENRTQNVQLAAKSINGVLVRPGDVFSFNTHVGPRLAEHGYREAPVFVDGRLSTDWGGGVCQVSSTLYNAVLLADLEIEERTAHFRPPGYVPLGQDATVADNQLDFKFRNTTDYNIYLMTEVTGNQLTVNIFGKRLPNSPEIRIIAADKQIIEPKTVIKQDPTLELGKEVVESEGQKGYQITTYRIKLSNGQEIAREFLASDEYKPVDRIIRVGIKTSPKESSK
ncbi:VanW family protein [Sporolituus thermophilus]|uniref:Vancomycin resistance protein YoaR, contains peptidoglycan-binding and VanW domains n=1 Tax=Sporolituus thermophilus DSM 23256 TaxID=1123285 RepID=A0A1G7M762_9FIRM|nr:VanW family protein [Sporolituus thermophilus]SDF57020.1 Vancomycin resistance protein YoaR, contains peptidoglycan-binding and VanW domains [Sporolituus thermophilus DSM 23256]